MNPSYSIAEQIVDTALSLAEKKSWEEVRLFDIAQQLKISLSEIHLYFREKDELIDAFFDRADKAMLEAAENLEVTSLVSEERLQALLMAWFKAIENHRRVAKEMIWGKLEPGHLHIQIPALMRISRAIQWWREAAHRPTSCIQRAIEETGLTTIFITTFIYWLFDTTKKMKATNHFLEQRLAQAKWIIHYCKIRCNKN